MCRQTNWQRHQPLYYSAVLTNLASCPIQFTSVFCDHDTSELLVYSLSSEVPPGTREFTEFILAEQ